MSDCSTSVYQLNLDNSIKCKKILGDGLILFCAGCSEGVKNNSIKCEKISRDGLILFCAGCSEGVKTGSSLSFRKM